MMPEQKNVWLAMAIIVAMFVIWQFVYELPRLQQQEEARLRQQELAASLEESTLPRVTGAETTVSQDEESQRENLSRDAAAALSQRLAISTPSLRGSIALTGGRIDDLTLVDYRVETEPDSAEVILLSPVGGPSPYFAEFGWLAEDDSVALPQPDSVWRGGGELTPDSPVTIAWDNGQGLSFERTFAVDEQYMFTVTQSVTNNGAAPVSLLPYGRIKRYDTPPTLGFYILHEGLIGVFNDTLEEVDYDDLSDADDSPEIAYRSSGGWLGITDKYWLVAMVPDQRDSFQARFLYHLRQGVTDTYQADFYRSATTVAPGGTVTARGPPVRWRQDRDPARRLCRIPEHPAVRPGRGLRLVLLPDQADLLRPSLARRLSPAISASPSWR